MPLNIHILLVEDSEDDAVLLIRELKKGGYEPSCERVDNAPSFLKSLDSKNWDIIISDYSMPDFNGLIALEMLKKKERDLPFIIVSGAIGEDIAVEAMKAGAHDYILKNNLKRLIPAIERELREAKIRRERKKADEELREMERKLFTLLSNLPGMAYCCRNDKDWTMEFVSEGCFHLTGYEPSDLINNRKIPYNDLIHRDDRNPVWDQVQDALKEKKPFLLIYRIITSSGEEKWVWEKGRGVFSDKEELLALEGFITDITDYKKAEEERKKLESRLQHAQKLESLGILAGGIAHDFNNILTGVLGYADLALLDLSPVSTARESIQQIVTAARRAAELTRQMLAYSGRGKFLVQSVRLSDIVREMSHLLEVSVSKKTILKYNFGKDLPLIEGDITQLRQVIMNLIINASDSIGDHSGAISVNTDVMYCDTNYLSDSYINEKLPEDYYVYLEVADTGCGMTEEIQARIFDPFFTTKFTGRGLGLAAVLGIIRSHHGFIKICSEPGRGTNFKVFLPALKSAGGEMPVEKPENKVWNGKGIILVIDDENTVRTVAKAMLARLGFNVLIAENGREGLEIYRNHIDEIGAVLLDMTMPGLNGEETFRELRLIKKTVQVILTSGYNEQEAISRFSGEGLAGFIQKPYRVDELVNVMKKVFGE